jgi:tyrosyl-tRNA synthetase
VENAFDILVERGFVEQVTDRNLVREVLESPTTCYIGFDPTAKSFHVGNLLPIMSLMHMQQAGHRPIIVIGGGTAMVGDPSGRTETRSIISREEIEQNATALKKQFSRFIDFSGGRALMVNNADWLTDLLYIDFLREIGRHFSVNRMLAAESYRARLETGLSFIEFNYMLLQAYDFWNLFKHYDCRLQMGGNDQWGNILAGCDLTRRLEGETVHALTFPLITTASNVKMGKTHKGAVWLDSELTSPYEYYQYWINTDDRDVGRFLAFFTFLPMDEVGRLGSLTGEEIREAKEVLAYETTKLCHGKVEADQAREASEQLFGPDQSQLSESVPKYIVQAESLKEGIPAYILFEEAGLCKTRGEARRLLSQGGGYLNGQRIRAYDQIIHVGQTNDGSLLLRAGKKKYVRIGLT